MEVQAVRLTGASSPHNETQRSCPRRRFAGLNSSAVGLVVSAMFKMLLQVHGVSPFPNTSLAIGILGYTLVASYKIEAPLVVVCGGLLGVVGFYAQKLM